MITKDQAESFKNFLQVAKPVTNIRRSAIGSPILVPDFSQPPIPLPKPIKWRANGKLKTWKRSPERFQLPIKHGLRDFAYITEENAHLFEIEN